MRVTPVFFIKWRIYKQMSSITTISEDAVDNLPHLKTIEKLYIDAITYMIPEDAINLISKSIFGNLPLHK